MPLSMYQASVAVYLPLLNALSATLDKAAAHAQARKIKPEALITARLFPDMWSLAEQVRAACSQPTRGTARLAGLPIPEFEGSDVTFDDLKARVAWAVKFLEGVDPAAVDGSEERPITFPMGGETRTMPGQRYFLRFTLPNFYFHLTTAYDILRHNGVALDKQDFTGGM